MYLDSSQESSLGIKKFGSLFWGYDWHALVKIRMDIPYRDNRGKELLKKAEEKELNDDEMTYLDIWSINRYLMAAGYDEEHIMYDRYEKFWAEIRKSLTRLEDRLLQTKQFISVGTTTISEILEKEIEQAIKKILVQE